MKEDKKEGSMLKYTLTTEMTRLLIEKRAKGHQFMTTIQDLRSLKTRYHQGMQRRKENIFHEDTQILATTVALNFHVIK